MLFSASSPRTTLSHPCGCRYAAQDLGRQAYKWYTADADMAAVSIAGHFVGFAGGVLFGCFIIKNDVYVVFNFVAILGGTKGLHSHSDGLALVTFALVRVTLICMISSGFFVLGSHAAPAMQSGQWGRDACIATKTGAHAHAHALRA